MSATDGPTWTFDVRGAGVGSLSSTITYVYSLATQPRLRSAVLTTPLTQTSHMDDYGRPTYAEQSTAVFDALGRAGVQARHVWTTTWEFELDHVEALVAALLETLAAPVRSEPSGSLSGRLQDGSHQLVMFQHLVDQVRVMIGGETSHSPPTVLKELLSAELLALKLPHAPSDELRGLWTWVVPSERFDELYDALAVRLVG